MKVYYHYVKKNVLIMNNSTTEAFIVKDKVANQPKIDERLSAGLISMHVSLFTCLLIWFHKHIYNKIICVNIIFYGYLFY